MTAAPQNVAQSSTLEALREKARMLRIHSMRMTTAAGSGHPTSCLSCAELVAATFFHAMHFDPADANAVSGDRFVLSKGHAAPILYAALAEAGVFPVSRLQTLRTLNSELEGHPTPLIPGVDAATGSLGQGLSVGAGLAIGARMAGSQARVYVLTGDGELAEGSVWEAAAFAAFDGLDNLTAICDINALGQSGRTMYRHDMEVYREKFEAQGWHTEVIDGHDLAAVVAALDRARTIPNRPQAIIARTDKGHGVSFLSDKEGWHGKPLSKEQLEKAVAELGGAPMEPPDDGRSYARKSLPKPPEFPAPAAPNYKPDAQVATREAYGFALEKLAAVSPKVVAIDGDVKNSTFSETIEKTDPKRLIEGYIAEQNMVGLALGLQAQGVIPFAATFACFLTRAFDQIRMAAVSRANVNLCGSHCGVSIGEDGPSQMGLEDLAMFRAVPNSTVLYPSDAVCAERLVETAARRGGVCYIRTSRPKTAILYPANESFPLPGFKVLRQSANDVACVVAAGVTLYEALKAYDQLKAQGKAIRVIDLYCVKPLEGAKLAEQIRGAGNRLITVEDHFPEGGIGEAVLTALAEIEQVPGTVRHLAVRGVPHSGKPDELIEKFGLSASHIVKAVTA
ncbi:MAG TPA: transketolase [Candidatus Acidoferrales bacterium]|nr:transketolase [Candidatus Acidoferrales bacterium]